MAKTLEARIRDALERVLDDAALAIAGEVRGWIAEMVGGKLLGARGILGAAARAAHKSAKRDMACIYPGCQQRSKGPRFSYLCEEHFAKKPRAEEIETWRKQRQLAAAKRTAKPKAKAKKG
jgi:hypothetical protein